MNAPVQIIQLPENSSFIAKEVDRICLSTGWHRHKENELILFTAGTGRAFIHKQEVPFETGDIFFLGSYLSHQYQHSGNDKASALVIQFRSSFLGSQLLDLPECQSIKQFLYNSTNGFQITGQCKQELAGIIQNLVTVKGIEKIILLLACLKKIATSKECIKISMNQANELHRKNSDCIDKVIRFTLESFHQPVSLRQVAAATCMSVPSFCHYFKHYTHTTYIDFLNEVRIEYASRQLLETNKSVAAIGYESGYNTIAHFHRQFLKFKKITPLQFRKFHSQSPHTINLKIPA